MLDALKRISTALGLVAATALATQAQAQTPARSLNQAMAEAVASALRSSPNLTPYRIEVDTNNRMVTLSGTVPTTALKNEALSRAASVPGLRAVIDHLMVRGDGTVQPVQYQVAGGMPNQMAGGMPAWGGGAPAGGEVIYDGNAAGGPGAGAGAGGPVMDGPMPEGPGGAHGATSAAMPRNPNYAWPSYAPYPNFSAVGYPTAYPWQAWPNIAPPYPYPEVPLDWRAVTLRWDDGIWWLDFKKHYTRPFFTPYPFGIFAY
jgi:hypothetical protein